MIIWLLMVFSFLSYSCNGSLMDQRTQSNQVAAVDGKAITNIMNIKTEVDVMKDNYDALLQRINNNEAEIALLKGQKQQMENDLEITKRTFSCEIEGLRDGTTQLEQELKETTNAWKTINDTIQDLGQRVNVLVNKYSPLEIPGKHSNESGLTGDNRECPLDWIRRVDFGACYLLSDKKTYWNNAQEQCSKQNGSLADIYSEKEFLWVADHCNQTGAKTIWIGGKREHGVFKWFTSDGKTQHMNYTRWIRKDYLPSSQNELCVNIMKFIQYKWFYDICNKPKYFICKTYL